MNAKRRRRRRTEASEALMAGISKSSYLTLSLRGDARNTKLILTGDISVLAHV